MKLRVAKKIMSRSRIVDREMFTWWRTTTARKALARIRKADHGRARRSSLARYRLPVS